MAGQHRGKDKAINFRTTKRLKDAIDQFALRENRSVAQVCEILIEEGLAKRGYITPIGAPGPIGANRRAR
jgi:hypothetical protein